MQVQNITKWGSYLNDDPKRGYYSGNYPSQSGSLDAFFEYNFLNNRMAKNYIGYQLELVNQYAMKF